MAEITPSPAPAQFMLPAFVRTREQIHTLIKEILLIEDFLRKAQVRTPGSKMDLPKTTADLDRLADANKMNVLNHDQRRALAHYLRDVYRQAPQINIAFTQSESPRFVDGVIDWFRKEVNPTTLAYLTPHAKIGAGAVIRIKHKTYDFSFKKRFDDNYQVLQEELRAGAQVPMTTTMQRGKYF